MISDRVFVSFPISDFRRIKLQMLNWCSQFSIFCFLDNHEYSSSHHLHECLLAAGALGSLEAEAGNAFEQLKNFSLGSHDWLFGHFGFDLKNETEKLSSGHPDGIQFPDLFFFIPELILELDRNQLRIGSRGSDHQKIFREISETPVETRAGLLKVEGIRSRLTRNEYIETVRQLGLHILRGDCYEINFCQEFYREGAKIDPVRTYQYLSEISPTPFAALYRLNDKWLMCASPERYLKRAGDMLIAQPIKGTRSRNLDGTLDDRGKEDLFYSGKDRAENVMVVDLVRNDLSKICLGSTEMLNVYVIVIDNEGCRSSTGIGKS